MKFSYHLTARFAAPSIDATKKKSEPGWLMSNLYKHIELKHIEKINNQYVPCKPSNQLITKYYVQQVVPLNESASSGSVVDPGNNIEVVNGNILEFM